MLAAASLACGGGVGDRASGDGAEPPLAPPAPAPAPSAVGGLQRLQVPHYALYDANLVVAERRIVLAGLPADTYAYNPTIVAHQDRLVAVVRLETIGALGVRLANRLAATTLDEHGRQLQPLIWLETPHLPGELWTAEDPRLIAHRGVLYVVYNMATNARADGPHRMHLARLRVAPAPQPIQRAADAGPDAPGEAALAASGADGASAAWDFRLTHDQELDYRHPDAPSRPHLEKNWSPFVYQDRLCFLYRSNPIVGICLTDAQLDSDAPTLTPALLGEGSLAAAWAHGQVRGGTPATYVAEIDRYVTFFHSHAWAKIGATEHRRHYFTGFYSFRPTPPFEIDRIAQAPIYTRFWLADLNPAEWHIAFAAGAVWRDSYVLVTYGRNDKESALMVLDRGELLRRLGHAAADAR